MRIALFADLHMSYTVNAATDAAVSASISTPVCAVGDVRAVAWIRTEAAAWSRDSAMDTLESGTW